MVKTLTSDPILEKFIEQEERKTNEGGTVIIEMKYSTSLRYAFQGLGWQELINGNQQDRLSMYHPRGTKISGP